MKKIYIIFTVVLSSLLITSCSTNHDDYDTDRESSVAFANLLELITVPFDANSIDFEIEFITSTVATTDREFQVTVNSETSIIDPENYSFNSMVVMPANKNRATFTFTAIDNSLSTSYEDIFLEFAPEVIGEITLVRDVNLKVRKAPN